LTLDFLFFEGADTKEESKRGARFSPQKGSLRGAKPLLKVSSPSPLKERGIKGVRLINSL